MKKKWNMNLVTKLTAGVLIVGMILAGAISTSQNVDAAVASDKVIYERYEEDVITENYWTENKKTAPVKEGYVFGGWFNKVETVTTNTETYTSDNGTEYYDPLTTVSGAAYAKFVPAQVLSVKAQNGVEEGMNAITKAEDISESNPMWVRVMTAQDSKNYEKIGFDIYLANKTKPIDNADGDDILESNKVFEQVYVGDTLTDAEDIFGDAAHYVSVWKLAEINYSGNAGKIIYVRPYWYTMDGTKVFGLAKYVHIEDDYLNYISVPVNLLGGEKIAAGAVNMTYVGDTALEMVGFEEGRIFSDMSYNYMGNTIKMIGNTDKAVDEYNLEETIYANLRFKEPNTTTEFNITEGEFCGWDEVLITDMKKVWDIRYDAQ